MLRVDSGSLLAEHQALALGLSISTLHIRGLAKPEIQASVWISGILLSLSPHVPPVEVVQQEESTNDGDSRYRQPISGGYKDSEPT